MKLSRITILGEGKQGGDMKAKFDEQFNKVYFSVHAFIIDNYAGLPSEGQLEAMYNELPDVDYEFDSSVDTLKHIKRVNELIIEFGKRLLDRAVKHDLSKLEESEKFAFDRVTPLLAETTFGSPEYKKLIEKIRPAVDHHQQNNSHHPEFYTNGIDGMNLLDLVEMFFDWKAAGERHNNGNIYKSIQHCKERFNLSEQLCNILTNTAKELKF
jgi:hypothetical protein